ncbi:alpha/beta hydrolase [Azospirillum formosense]|uniref:alpha/beta fold hydrolase n=1 Tax=Azospirillum formosense TaxID=861533 RepID=UPI0033902758
MTGPLFVFVHGWGFGPRVWDAVRAALPDAESVAVDLGFYGPPSFPMIAAGRPVVAVGHSFGGLWLLHERPFAWDGLVLVNGFPRFAEGDGFAPATPRRLLDRMVARFDAAPQAVTGDFLHRCGVEAPRPEGLDAARLGAALRALRDWDARAALVGPALALAGAQDPIVPPAMTEQALAGIDVGWHPEGGHLLPLTAPDWCAERIAAFAAGLAA